MKQLAPEVRRRRAVAALVALVVVVVAAAVALASGGGSSGGPAPASGAAAVVPADALVYVHLSTDGGRPAVRRALALAERFPGFPLLAAALERAVAPSRPVSFASDIRPWLGREAAVALLENGTGAPAPLIVLDVARRARAQAFLGQIGARTVGTYRGAQLYTRRGAALAFASHYLVLGSRPSVQAALDVTAGHGASLAADSAYRQAAAASPPGVCSTPTPRRSACDAC